MIEPPVPIDLDLRSMPFMPLDVVRLRDSDIARVTSGEAFRAAVLLWCVAWHQVPASSLPKDDAALANYAGFGRDVKSWLKVKASALHGFEECIDGRLYHAVIAEKALETEAKRQSYRERTKRATETRRQRNEQRKEQRNDNVTTQRNDERNVADAPDAPETKVSKGKVREGKVTEEREDAAVAAPVVDPEKDLFDRGKAILGRESGGLIKNLLKAKGSVPQARAALEVASTKRNPREYIGGCLKGAGGDDLHANGDAW